MGDLHIQLPVRIHCDKTEERGLNSIKWERTVCRKGQRTGEIVDTSGMEKRVLKQKKTMNDR